MCNERIQTPSWVQDAVFYQIFPDRFAQSNRDGKPPHLLPWSSPPTPHGYHGGDLWGLIDHLDHLTDLGINAIYLNPIFQSACNHRYHTHDYEKVDPLLGGDDALRAMIEQAHQRDMRIILDGVFNHASRGFFPFSDVLENGPESPWLDWFFIDGWPLSPYDGNRPANYAGWLGNRELPKLNTDNPQVREYIMTVGERWVRDFDIDGWRLDVPQEISSDGFWEEFRHRVRALKPDAYLLGEIWHHAPEWLQGDRFDATMNYPFAAATIAFAGGHRISPTLPQGRSYDPHPGIDAVQYARRIEEQLGWYDWEITKCQLNLLASHDTPRVISLARGDRDTVRLATLLQMTMPGAPCIYYGDEIIVPGAEDCDGPHHDHEARRTFPWHDPSAWDAEMLTFYREAVAMRHANRALRRGRHTTLFAEGGCYAFLRAEEEEQLVVVINAEDNEASIDGLAVDGTKAGAEFRRILGEGFCQPTEQGRLAVTVPARRGVVYRVE